MNELFWLNEPTILFRKDKLMEFWPYSHMSFTQKLNASTRFVMYISLFGYALLNNYLILMFGIILVLLIIYLYSNHNKINVEAFEQSITQDKEKFTSTNPLYNVMMTDYDDNVNKTAIQSSYNETHEDAINTSVKQFVLENNKDNKDIGKIFKNVANNMEFESSMRQFHMNPSTTIPNDQKDFLKYCYGNLPSEKPLNVY